MHSCFGCVFQQSWGNLADLISPKEIIDLTANWLASPRAWWRGAKSISSHDKAGNSWALQEGHSIHCIILIKIIAPILLCSSTNSLAALLFGELPMDAAFAIFILIWRVSLNHCSKSLMMQRSTRHVILPTVCLFSLNSNALWIVAWLCKSPGACMRVVA